MIKFMKISEIKITDAFKSSCPNEIKVNKCRDYWNKHQTQSKIIVVNKNNVLVDGYIQYLVLKENNVMLAEVNEVACQNQFTTYIYGIHQNGNGKEYVWKVPKFWKGWENDLLPGDSILVKTKYGIKEIIITKIEWLDECPIDKKVENVYKKIENK